MNVPTRLIRRHHRFVEAGHTLGPSHVHHTTLEGMIQIPIASGDRSIIVSKLLHHCRRVIFSTQWLGGSLSFSQKKISENRSEVRLSAHMSWMCASP